MLAKFLGAIGRRRLTSEAACEAPAQPLQMSVSLLPGSSNGHTTNRVWAAFYEGDTRIGEIDGYLGPFPTDRFYVTDIRVPSEYRHKGRATEMLCMTGRLFNVALSPVHIVEGAVGFWPKAAAAAAKQGVEITEGLSIDAYQAEASRWARRLQDYENGSPLPHQRRPRDGRA